MLTSHHTAWDFDPVPEVAIVPLAGCEPHGPHLPIGTDAIIMDAIATRVAERLPAPIFLLPMWPLGTALPHHGQPGAISLSYDTLWAVVDDVVSSLHAHGIQRVVVLNNHGSAMTTTTRPAGNFIVKTAVRQLNYERPGLTAIWVQPFAAARQALRELFASADRERHAGAIETSLMLHLAPDTVGELAPDFFPEKSAAWLDMAPFRELAPAGVWGAPRAASAEKGAQAIEVVVAATADYIQRTFAQVIALKNHGSSESDGSSGIGMPEPRFIRP
jgi:creatinine amidohydrolase